MTSQAKKTPKTPKAQGQAPRSKAPLLILGTLAVALIVVLVILNQGPEPEAVNIYGVKEGEVAAAEKGRSDQLLQGEAGDDSVHGRPADPYWVRLKYTGIKKYDVLVPFRKPTGFETRLFPNGRRPGVWDDLNRLRGFREAASEDKRSFDKTGREVVDTPAWRKQLERVRISNLSHEGHLAQVYRDSVNVGWRRDALYGMFYFDDTQKVFDLIAQISAEPDRRIRAWGYELALKYLAAHLPQSVPLDSRSDSSPLIPKFRFNAWGYLQLVRIDDAAAQANGLWFLTEVLRIRPDLGRAYLGEIKDVLRDRVISKVPVVRRRAAEFLLAVDRKNRRPPKGSATDKDVLAWFNTIVYELFPPIEHISTGEVVMHPSKDLNEIIQVGKATLAKKGSIGAVKLVSLKNQQLRRGLEIERLPKPLGLLGIPKGAVIFNINDRMELYDSVKVLEAIKSVIKERKDKIDKIEKRRKKPEKQGDKEAKIPPLVFQVWYVHKGVEYFKNYRVDQ